MKYKLNKIVQIILVNLITFCRLIGAIILPFIYVKYGPNISSLLTIVLFFSDAIDGFLARALHCSTFFGSLMDSFSDKLLNAISFVLLGITYNIMFGPLILEIAIILINYSTYIHKGNVQSSKIGKIKTIILDICVIASFILLSIPNIQIYSNFINLLILNTNKIINLLGGIITISSIIALIDYVRRNKEVQKNKKLKRIKFKGKIKKNIKELTFSLFNPDYYYKNKDGSIMKLLYK